MSTETETPAVDPAPAVVDPAPAVSDLPNGDPIKPPPPAPSSSSSPRPVTKKLPLSVLLAAATSNVDSFAAHLARCFQTPSSIDVVLCFLCYTSRFSAAALESVSASALRRSARRLIALAFSLPRDTTLLSTKPPAPPAAAAAALQLAGHLRALATLLSEARTITRLWALLPMYIWLRRLMTTPRLTEEEKEKDVDGSVASRAAVDRAISWLQVTACILLQSLESGSYLASKGVLPLSPKQTGRAAQWSVRFWSVYVGSELGRLLVEWLRRRQQFREGKVDVESEGYKEELGVWQRTLARQAAWFPLTVHWSMNQGFVPEIGIGFLGSIPGIVQMRQLWKETA